MNKKVIDNDYLIVMLLRGGGAVTSLLFVSVAGHILDVTSFGFLASSMSLVLLVSVLSSYGQHDKAVVNISRKLSEAGGRDSKRVSEDVIDVILVALVVSLFFSTLSIMVAIFIMDWGVAVSFCLAISFIALSVERAFSGISRAYRKYCVSLAPREIAFRVMLVLVLYMFSEIFPKVDEVLIAVSILVSAVTVTIVQSLFVDLSSVGKVWLNKIKEFYPLFLNNSVSVWLSSVCLLSFTLIDVIVLGYIGGDKAAAEYYPANRLALIVVFFQWAQQVVLSGSLARVSNVNEYHSIRLSYKFAFVYSSVPALCAFVVILSVSDYYEMIFPTFTQLSMSCLVVLSAGWLFQVLVGPMDLVLLVKGDVILRAVIHVSSLLLMLFGALYFSNKDNALGVAFVVSIVIVIKALVEFLFVLKKYGVFYTYISIFKKTITNY